MGTDITAFVESASEGQAGPVYFAYARLWLPRDRELFTALGRYGSGDALGAAKGLPSDTSPEVNEAYYLWVVDPESEAEWRGQTFLPRQEAETAVRLGRAVYPGSAHDRIADPDNFAPSWLTRSELLAAIRYANLDLTPRPHLALALSIMVGLEDHSPLGVRMVYWFSA